MLTLVVSGNLSWLNWIRIVLCIPTLDDRWFSWLPLAAPALQAPHTAQRVTVYAVVALVAVMSVKPVVNLLSAGQLMNYSFNPVHLVNTYGAFGSITRTRNEIVIEATDDAVVTDATTWREYEFKGKPGDPSRRPPQIAPYHLRLDWLMWFAAMSSPSEHPWFTALLVKLLRGRRRRARPAAGESLSRSTAALRARAVLRVSVHDAEGAPADRPVVEPRAARRLLFPRRVECD